MLFPQRKKLQAGQKIQQLLADADQNLPNKDSIISGLLQKHFGTPNNPNMDLMPNAPASEQTGILQLLKNEITSSQAGTLDHMPGFQDIQSWKRGAGKKGRFDKSITNSQQELWRNISNAYGGVIKDAVPEIAKQYDTYTKAKQALAQHGGGITGAAHQLLNGGGALGYTARYALVYPLIRKTLQALHEGIAPTPQTQTNNIGWKGNY